MNNIKLGNYYNFSDQDYHNSSMHLEYEKDMIDKIICNAYYNITNHKMPLLASFEKVNTYIHTKAKKELYNFCPNDFNGAYSGEGIYKYWANKETGMADTARPVTNEDRHNLSKKLIERYFKNK